MICTVVVTPAVQKKLKKVPLHVQQKLFVWVASVEANGVEVIRRQPGWHDEPLTGKRDGQRSIRLSRQWRCIYVVLDDGSVEFCEVREITPHDY